MKHLVGKVITKKVAFMGEEVTIKKMGLNEIFEIQEQASKASKSKNEKEQINLLKFVLKKAVEGAAELTDDDFNQFPLAELNSLSNEVLGFSGMGNDTSGNLPTVS